RAPRSARGFATTPMPPVLRSTIMHAAPLLRPRQCAIQRRMRRIAAIDTARLRLRPYRESDLDALHALWTDPQVRRYLWDDAVIERRLAAEVMRASIASTDALGFGHWAVCRGNGGALIGFCGFRPLDDSADIELLYGLAPPHWGRGLATEAARAMLRFGFEE